MAFAQCYSAVSVLGQLTPIQVQVHVSNGLPGFSIVGMAQTAVKEAKDRVRSAILNSGLEFPQKRITVNLTPAHIPKAGSNLDLAIAYTLLKASAQIPCDAGTVMALGELNLDGQVRVLSSAHGFAACASTVNCSLLANTKPSCFARVIQLNNLGQLAQYDGHSCEQMVYQPSTRQVNLWPMIAGSHYAKWVALVALIGRHSLLLSGPPGTGKTMLCDAMIQLQPPLTKQSAAQCAMLATGNALDQEVPLGLAPSSAPHHNISAAALVGGAKGNLPAICQAHEGILFLDELHEFSSQALDQLRQPIERGEIELARASYCARLPANFQLIAATNPCKCGYWGSDKQSCQCSQMALQKHHSRLSGPLLERFQITLHQEADANISADLCAIDLNDTSQISQRLIQGRQRQIDRQSILNCRLPYEHIKQIFDKQSALINRASEQVSTGVISYRRLLSALRVALSIADLNQRAPTDQDITMGLTLASVS